MSERTAFLFDAAKRALQRPGNLSRILLTRRGWHGVRYAVTPPKHGGLDQSRRIAARTYRSYDDYVRHQRSKLALLDLGQYDPGLRAGLAERLRPGQWQGRSVLCLAARLGGEVRAFHDLGAFAVGVDLNPGNGNAYVLPGDFHDLTFPDSCVDAVYSNSLDHALDLTRLLAEAGRVLKNDGTLIVDAQAGTESGRFDDWAATSWRSTGDLCKAVSEAGFTLLDRHEISVPWQGECLRFVPS